MAEFDEAFSLAACQLVEHGSLLNNQLLRFADGDEQLADQIRTRLIEHGLANDRFGVALSATANASDRIVSLGRMVEGGSSDETANDITFASAESELEASDHGWWLMSGGVTTGPFEFPAMRQMRRLGQISRSDVVRCGSRGIWQSPDDVVGLGDVSDLQPEKPAQRPDSVPLRALNPVSPVKRSPFPQVPAAPTPEFFRDAREATFHLDRDTATDNSSRTSTDISAIPRASTVRSDETVYFLWDAGKPVGPISRDELEARVQAGRLSADEFVQVGKDGDWHPVSTALTGQWPALVVPSRADSRSDGVTKPGDSNASLTIQNPIDRSVARPQRSGNRLAGKSDSGIKTRSQTATTKSGSIKERSAVAQAWCKAEELVGRGRLVTMVVTIIAAVALVTWWRQPPSARAVYDTLDEIHQKLQGLQQEQVKSKEISGDLAKEESRVRLIRDGLKKRASSTRPAEQELLWACEHGLLPLLSHQRSDPDVERVYAGHMSRALAAIDPAKAQPRENFDDPVAPVPHTK